MTTQVRRKLDYDDYVRLPDDGKRHEILDGKLYVTPSPNPYHQRLSKRLQRRLEDYFEAPGRGEVFDAPIDLILGVHDIAVPDILVVGNEQQISRRGIEGAPLLVVEVLSPSTRGRDRGVKMRRYAALEIPHYWIADPDRRRIQCFRVEAGTYQLVVEAMVPDTLTHPDFPGLSIDLVALWR